MQTTIQPDLRFRGDQQIRVLDEIRDVRLRFSALETGMHAIESRFSGMETRFAALEVRFGLLEQRVDGVVKQLGDANRKLDHLAAQIGLLGSGFPRSVTDFRQPRRR